MMKMNKNKKGIVSVRFLLTFILAKTYAGTRQKPSPTGKEGSCKLAQREEGERVSKLE